ncbi:MAG TPA: response regulator [Candidatus Paceibacterota bacterium]|nr:response regulator [Candidatus Paceibacterota bacterium]
MKKTILIVEDEKSLREAIADILRRNDFLPLEAVNGKEGVELALSKHPDLILLDLIMPEMDGMTALKNIRADAWGATVPTVILTNLSASNEQLIDDVVTHKPMHYLIKSDWKIHDVIKKVKDILEMKDVV